MLKVEGQQVEPVGAEGVRFGEGCSLPNGGWVWGWAVPSPEFFLLFCLGMLHFGCNLMHFQTQQGLYTK